MNLSLDTVLEVLENPNRRRILAKLVQESHYPLQLANELQLTQQAVMKHLKVMERKGLVDFKEEPSSRGGPPRKSYFATQEFSVRIDVFNHSFDAKLVQSRDADLGSCTSLDCAEDMATMLTDISQRLDMIETERMDLIARRDEVERQMRQLIGSEIDNYEQRKILYHIVKHPLSDLDDVSDALDLRQKLIQQVLVQEEAARLLAAFCPSSRLFQA